MTKDEVIALARQAEGEQQEHGMWRMHVEDLERFAAIIAKAERKRIVDMLLDMHAKERNHNYYGFIANIIKESA